MSEFVTVLGLKLLQLFLTMLGTPFQLQVHGCDREQRNELMCAHNYYIETSSLFKKWHSNLAREHSVSGNGGNKLRTNRLFKKTFQLCHIWKTTTCCYRVALARLWVGAHALAEEVGRYNKTSPTTQSTTLCLL